MADIARWDPFSELATLRRTMDSLFDEGRPWRALSGGGSATGAEGHFPVDLYETNDSVVVQASLPGVKPEDIEISVTAGVLTLKGESKDDHEEKTENFYRRERRHGTFLRQFTLPSEVDSAKADAVFEHGVLKLTLPKAETAKPTTIKVQAKPLIEAKAS